MSSKLRWLAAFAAGVAISGGVAVATTGGGREVIRGCVGPGGVLRVPDNATCRAFETSLNWNQRGVRGPRGYPGPQGPAGPATGVPGPPGPRGLPGGAASLDRTTSAAEAATPIGDGETDADVPGSMTVDVPEGALVAINSTADLRLVTSCPSAIAFVSVVDAAEPGVYLSDAGVSTTSQWASEEGADPSLSPTLLSGLLARRGETSDDPLPEVEPTGGGETPAGFEPFSYVNRWMSPYFIVSPGEHTFTFVHDIENWSDSPCTDATLHSRDRRMWVSVMTPTQEG